MIASLPVRDPVGDHLLTPHNAALAVIDYQPSQFAGVRSMDRDLLLENANHRDPVTPRHLPAGNPGGGTPLAGSRRWSDSPPHRERCRTNRASREILRERRTASDLKDLWQHRTGFVAGTRWWPPFCATVDWVAAALLAGAITAGLAPGGLSRPGGIAGSTIPTATGRG